MNEAKETVKAIYTAAGMAKAKRVVVKIEDGEMCEEVRGTHDEYCELCGRNNKPVWTIDGDPAQMGYCDICMIKQYGVNGIRQLV